MLSRRAFLGRLAAAVTAVAVAPAMLEACAPVEPAIGAPVVSRLPQTFQVGDVLTIAGRQAIHPLTRRPTGHLQQFVVTAVTDDVQIAMAPALTIHPRLIGPGSPYQNVSSAAPFRPEDVQPVVWAPQEAQYRSKPPGLAFHPNAFAMVWK